MEEMANVHMSEAEVARDLHAVLAKLQQGIEVVIEQDHRPSRCAARWPDDLVNCR